MRIADICTRQVVHIGPDRTVLDAAKIMRERHVGALVVVEHPNGDCIPIGMLTDRDIVVSVTAPEIDASILTVADVMSRRVATCLENSDLYDAIRLMRSRGVRRLPVLDAGGGLAGIVSIDDIYGALSEHMRDLSQALTREQVQEMAKRSSGAKSCQ